MPVGADDSSSAKLSNDETYLAMRALSWKEMNSLSSKAFRQRLSCHRVTW